MTTAELIDLLKGEKKNILASQGKPAVAGDEHAQIAPLDVREPAHVDPKDLPERPEQGPDESDMEFRLRMRDWQREVAKAQQTANDMRSEQESSEKLDEPKVEMDKEIKIRPAKPDELKNAAPDAGVPHAEADHAEPDADEMGGPSDGDEDNEPGLLSLRKSMVSFKPSARIKFKV